MSYYARNPDDLSEAEEREIEGPLTLQQRAKTAAMLTKLIVERDMIETSSAAAGAELVCTREREAHYKARALKAEASLAETNRLFHLMGAVATLLADELDDDGDRTFLGSTNHADMLRELKDRYFQWRFDHNEAGPANILSDLNC